MKTIPNVPKIGDILIFTTSHSFMGYKEDWLEISKDTMAQVLDIHYKHEYQEEYIMTMLLGIRDENEAVRVVEFDYSVNQYKVKKVEESQALKILYGKK